MIFDISFVSSSGSPAGITRLAQRSEECGFNAVWMAHDLLWDNSWVVCGAIAASTSRIKIGPGIVNPYSCSLPEIAMAAASLDNLSGGRCLLGIGPGAKEMLAAAGIRPTSVISRLEYSVAYLRRALATPSSILRINLARNVPLYVGCQSPKLLECIGKWGIGGLPLLTPPTYASSAFAQIERGAESTGILINRQNQIASILVSLSRDEQEALKTFAEFIIPMLKHLSYHQLAEIGIDKDDVDEVVRTYSEDGWEAVPSKFYQLGAVGIEGCIKAVNEVSKAGFIHVKIGSPLGPQKEEAINICAREVIPHFV